MNFAHFYEFWCFSLGKQARFTLNFCAGMPLRKVHELTFLWFGLPGLLLRKGPKGIPAKGMGKNAMKTPSNSLTMPEDTREIPLGTLGLHFIILFSVSDLFLVIISSWFTRQRGNHALVIVL